MLRHYFMMWMRILSRHKLYSFINVAGLALGFTCVIFILLFIRYETSFDRWVPDSAHLYRVELTADLPGRGLIRTALTPFPMAKTMQERIPGVVAATRLHPITATLWVGHRRYSESVDVADPNFFQVIRLPLLAGDPADVLDQPNALVLSEATARQFFGPANPIGRTVTVRWIQCSGATKDCTPNSIALTVTGVMRDLPPDSQLAASVVAPNTSIFRSSRHDQRTWLTASGYSYVKLAAGASPRTVLANLRPIMDRAMAAGLARRDLQGPGSRVFTPRLIPFQQVHLESSGDWQNMTPAGSWITVCGAGVIGLLILLLACFNFMNLTTARATLRAREISLRKCVGASRGQLIRQFLAESVALSLCSMVLALALAEVLLPSFDRLLGRPLAFDYVTDWGATLALFGITLGTGLLSGTYPAFVLSSFRPGAALRTGGSGHGSSAERLRSGLVVLQFAVSIALGIGAIVAARQLSFARRINVGFDPRNILVMRAPSPHTRSFLSAVLKYPAVLGAALSTGNLPFGRDFRHGHPLGLVQIPGRTGTILLSKMRVDPSFPVVYRIPLLAGRLLSATRSADTLSSGLSAENAGHDVLINAAAAARFGYTPKEAVGKTILFDTNPVRIVGVLGNIKDSGALAPSRPTVFLNDEHHMQTISIRISDRNVPATLAFIDRTWRHFAPLSIAHRYFLSAHYKTFYRDYERQGTMLDIFVAVAILIACLGLFGLTAFTAERRTKEIGVRKIAGAREHDIVGLMLWRVSMPVLLGNLIAWPSAYYVLRRWLDGYAYRISLSPDYFLAGSTAALMIAWLTVLMHTLRLARTSPVHALRYE